MISDGAVKALVAVIAKCEAGVEYKAGVGALCPDCGEPMATTTTRPVIDGLRERYHRCASATCIVRIMEQTVKSIEDVDNK